MTRRTNLLTLRKYFAWRSIWFQTDSYQGLVVRDLVINTFLTGIFRRLGIVSSHFSIRSTIFSINIIETELFFFHHSRIIPTFFLDFSFFHSFNSLIHFFRIHMSKKNSFKNTLLDLNYFLKLVKYLQVYISFFIYLVVPFFYGTFTREVSSFFLKSNLLYSSYSPIVRYIHYKFQFNLFYSFLTASIGTRFRSISNSTNLQRGNFPIYTRSTTSGFAFLSYRSNIFNQFSSRYRALKRASKQHSINKSSSLPWKSVCTFFVPSFSISYEFLFIMSTYFNCKASNFNFKISNCSSIHYFFLLAKLSTSPIVGSFNSSFFSHIYIALQQPQKGSSVLFFYWIFKRLWLSFFNSSFLCFLDTISISFKQVFSYLTKIYNFVFLVSVKKKYSFFFNSLYITLFRQFNKYLCKESSIAISFYSNALNYLYSDIERSLCSYTGSSFIFFPRFFFGTPAFITNSKIICEYLIMCLTDGFTISSAYRKIARWHRSQREYIKTKMSYAARLKRPDTSSHFYKSQLKGIRITCSGPPYKARRKMRKKYHLWLAREFVSGIMPLQSFKFNIDYYQSYVRLKRSSIGIKVWTLFEKYEDKVFW